MDNTYDNMSNNEILNTINYLEICILATINNNIPYIVPVYYDIKRREESLVIMIKSKYKSQKIISIMRNSNVSLLFYNHTTDGIETVFAVGISRVETIKSDIAVISIKVNTLSGRKYYN